MRRRLLGFVIIALFPILSFAQDSDLGNWMIYIGNKSLGNGWGWHHEVQYRNYNFAGDLEQLLLRTGIGKNLSENTNLLFGYGYIISQNYVGEAKVGVNENRFFLQFVTKQQFGGAKLQHRYRFEQRFIESDFRLRFRYFLALNLPLSKEGIVDKSFYASFYNEIFLNTDNNIFDRNRVYGGLGYKLSPAIRIELGYMTQLFQGGARDQANIIVFGSL